MFMKATRYAADPVIALRSHPRLTTGERQRLGKVDERKLRLALEAGVSVLEPEWFPETLVASDAYDQALFVWGDVSCLFRPTVAIVGTRRATVYGRAVAQKFAESLARAGVTIVSGGAQGIDAAAHRGALEVAGSTAAVLGGGVDRVFPAVHAELFRKIRTGGCLVSQFPVGCPSLHHNFLARNHLIAALSLAVIVVEAPSQSGALVTAHAAADLNRPVFVVPGTIDRDSFRGSHDLIRHGATLVDHPDQVMEDLGIEALPEVVAPSSITGQRVLDALDAEPITPEALADAIGIELSELLSELTLLEIEGKVVRDGPGFALRP
jgi:DNA processing protein